MEMVPVYNPNGRRLLVEADRVGYFQREAGCTLIDPATLPKAEPPAVTPVVPAAVKVSKKPQTPDLDVEDMLRPAGNKP